MTVKITALDMSRAYIRHFTTYTNRYKFGVPNIYPDDWKGTMQWKEMDLMCVRKSGFVDEIECKISRSDFKADFKKTIHVVNGTNKWGSRAWGNKLKHSLLEEGYCYPNYFSFLAPEGLLSSEDIPPYAGWFEAYWQQNTVRIRERKQPKRLHKNKIDLSKVYEKIAFRYTASFLSGKI